MNRQDYDILRTIYRRPHTLWGLLFMGQVQQAALAADLG